MEGIRRCCRRWGLLLLLLLLLLPRMRGEPGLSLSGAAGEREKRWKRSRSNCRRRP